MNQAKATRIFDKKRYELVSNPFGESYINAMIIKEKYHDNGYSVRVPANMSLPHVYPEGRYFVYVRKVIPTRKKTSDSIIPTPKKIKRCVCGREMNYTLTEESGYEKYAWDCFHCGIRLDDK